MRLWNKGLLSLILAMLVSMGCFAQNDLVVFSEDGDAFTLFVNGAKKNDTPAPRVKAENLTETSAAVRIVFADDVKPEIRKNMTFLTPNTEVTAKITMTKKGLKLKYFGEAPIGTTPDPIETDDFVEEETAEVVEEPAATTTTTTVVTEEVTMNTGIEVDESDGSESVKVNMGVNGVNFNMGIEVNDGDSDGATETMTTTTTTTTTTTSSSKSDLSVVKVEDDMEGPCGPVKESMASIRSAMEAEAFADDKMNVGKQALRNGCIRVSGIKELAMLFSFEDDRLEFVKYCYDRCYDTDNYYQLNTIFTFSDNKEALNRFLETR